MSSDEIILYYNEVINIQKYKEMMIDKFTKCEGIDRNKISFVFESLKFKVDPSAFIPYVDVYYDGKVDNSYSTTAYGTGEVRYFENVILKQYERDIKFKKLV